MGDCLKAQLDGTGGVRLEADRPGTRLRWLRRPGLSARSYQTRESHAGSCVSTRSDELTVVLEGEVWLEYGPARQQLRLRPGEAGLVARGTPHRFNSTVPARYLIVDLRLALPGLGACHLTSGQIPARVEPVLERLWEQAATGESGARCLQVLRPRLEDAPFLALEPAHGTGRMLAVKAHLEQRFAEPFDLGRLAQQFGMDRFYLARNFQRNFGFPPLAYVQFLRMERYVWSMLEVPRQSSTRAALEAGFGDYATFSRRAHRTFGRPPSQLILAGSREFVERGWDGPGAGS